MTIPEAYSRERWITEAVGNNAFNYQERAVSHPEPNLRIAPLEYFDSPTAAFQKLAISRSPAFEVFEDNQLHSYAGLEKFLLFSIPGSSAPVFVFDNHNHAFFFWHWYAGNQHLSLPLDLIHVDQHKDTRIPATFLSASEIANWKELDIYTTEILNVGNFISPALKTGLIKIPQIIDSSASLQQLATGELPDNFILDIDLDFFAPELDYLDNQLKLTAIKKALAKASIITIATSPYFIDQDLAFKFLRKIFEIN